MKRNFAINEDYMAIARKNDSYAAYQKECFDKGHYNMEEIDRHWDLKKHGFSFQSVMNDVFVKNQDKNKAFYVIKDNYGNYLIAAKNGVEKFLWRFDNELNHSLYRFHKWVGDDTVVIVNFLSNGGVRFYQERVKTGENIVLDIRENEGVKFLYNGGLSEKKAEDYKKKIEEYNKDAEPEDFNSVVGFLKEGGFVEIEEKDANFSCGSKKNFSLYTLIDFEKGDKVITDHDDRVQEIVEVTVDSHGNKKFKLSETTGLWSANQLSPADKKAKGWIEIRPNVWWCGESDEEDEYCWLFFKNKKYVHFPFDYISQEGVEISFTEGIMDAQSIVERSNKAIDLEKLANDVDEWTKNFSLSKEGLHFPNSNITFFGTKYDVNGNKQLVFDIGGYNKFSIYPSTIDSKRIIPLTKGKVNLKEFVNEYFGSVEKLEKTMVSYIVNRGSDLQKKRLYYNSEKIDFSILDFDDDDTLTYYF